MLIAKEGHLFALLESLSLRSPTVDKVLLTSKSFLILIN